MTQENKKECCPECIDGCRTPNKCPHFCHNRPTEEKWEKRRAMMLVNKLYELAELTVKKRQSINDTADEIVMEYSRQLLSTQREEIREKVERIDLKVLDRQNIKSDVIDFYKDAVEETKRVVLSILKDENES